MTHAEFAQEMFDLCDMWTKTADEAEYIEFLQALYPHVTGTNDYEAVFTLLSLLWC